jgi:hypothetical protein
LGQKNHLEAEKVGRLYTVMPKSCWSIKAEDKKKPAGKGGYLPVEGGESKGVVLLSLSDAAPTA